MRSWRMLPVALIAALFGDGALAQTNRPGPPDASALGYMTPACPASGKRASIACMEGVSSRVALTAPLRIIPYKSGLVDLEFACDRQAAERFFGSSAGEAIDFVAGGTVVASATAVENPSTSRCALLGGGLGEAIETCEAFAAAAGKDKGACRTPCGQGEAWACIVHD